jgi:hypothetical protein
MLLVDADAATAVPAAMAVAAGAGVVVAGDDAVGLQATRPTASVIAADVRTRARIR